MKLTAILPAILPILFNSICFDAVISAQSLPVAPLRLAVAGTTHGHVAWILDRENQGKTDVVLVGIYEPDTGLAKRLAAQYRISQDLFHTDLDQMLDKVKPEAVAAFGSIYAHRAVVEACAPRGIHVMVEKPLAVSVEHAIIMEELAIKHKIHLLTNFETSWYPSTEKAYQLVNDSNYLGKIRKVVIHDGHEGPREIGVSDEFFNWLTDPVQNGGGALVDFGCYGANLMTYLMQDEEAVSVTASLRQFKPGIYPKVDDDATIIVDYPSAQCVIMGSWNWPFGRKDMEIYGETGYVISVNNTHMRIRNRASAGERSVTVSADEMKVYTDPFSYFADVIRGRIQVPENGTYSLENNMRVVRILDAARESARTGRTINLQTQTDRK